MSAKHTPGPWAIVEKTDPVVISNWSLKIGRHQISFFPYVYQYGDESKTCGGYVSDPEMHANARLIAAAPDLAFQLLAAANYIDALGGDSKSYRAAIAKATGSAS